MSGRSRLRLTKLKRRVTSLLPLVIWAVIASAPAPECSTLASPASSIPGQAGAVRMAMDEPIVEIQSGTYFGECLLDCHEQITLRPGQVVYSLRSTVPDSSHPDIEVETSIAQSEWDRLVEMVNVDRFNALPARIGQPDASDAGGEWVQISDGRQTRRVDLDLGATIPDLAPLLSRLRELRQRLAQQHGRQNR
jgi:hypothetical protein